MRFKKGDTVEIMNTKEAPVSWRVAEILSGNGRTYLVEYHSCPGTANEKKVETVSRKFVRPCPPLVRGMQSYTAGDIVEVFYEFSWKIAAILKVLLGKKEHKSNKLLNRDVPVQNRYLVRLLGCSLDFTVDQSNIRMRQTWHDEKWIMLAKSSQGGKDSIACMPERSNCYRKMNFQIPQVNARTKKELQKECTNIQVDAALRDSPMISSRSLKRKSPYSSVVEAHNERTQKVRAIEKGGRKQRVVATPLLEKVDAVSYPREHLGLKNMHASYNITSSGYNQIERAKLNDFIGVRGSESNSSDSDACSVGSCSVTSQSPSKCYSLYKTLPCQETDTLCSDAESCYGSSSYRKSNSVPPEEEVEVSIHRLELHAYRSTLEALYASGPLSWEQEALLTNLRIMLNISNDVHLVELKHLTSDKSATKVR